MDADDKQIFLRNPLNIETICLENGRFLIEMN